MQPDFTVFEKAWLGWSAYARHIIVPWLVISIICYVIGSLGQGGQKELHRLVLVGFFSIYFLIVRTGLHIMSHNLHDELKKKFQGRYAEALKSHHDFGFIGLKLGATLARIKRDLHMAQGKR